MQRWHEDPHSQDATMRQPMPSSLVLSTAPTRRVALAGVLLVGLSLSACIVVPSGRHYGGYGGYGGPGGNPGNPGDDVVSVAPPAPQVDVVIAAPGPGYFWIGGFWNWVGGRHLWVGGHWQAHRPGYFWTPHAWQRHGQGWRARPGQWQRG
jgi:hypothetical protein